MKSIKSIKKDNKNKVREIIAVYGNLTKPELAMKTGLSVVTINSLISEMVLSGEVVENGHVPSDGGRPSMQYGYNFDFHHFVIVYGYQKASQNYFQFAVTNLKGEIIKKREMKKDIDSVDVESFKDILDEFFAEDKRITMIVFGLPGASNDEEVVINDYKGIIGNTFIPFYRERYKVQVVFENDINAMTYGYYYFEGSANSVIGIYFPRIYAPGGGAIINGEIYKGVNNFAGEIGFAFSDIQWDSLDYGQKSEVLPLIGKVLTIYSCIIAPETYVLYGDFFQAEDAKWLCDYIVQKTDGKFETRIIVSNHLEEDYERGLIAIGLDRLNKLNTTNGRI